MSIPNDGDYEPELWSEFFHGWRPDRFTHKRFEGVSRGAEFERFISDSDIDIVGFAICPGLIILEYRIRELEEEGFRLVSVA